MTKGYTIENYVPVDLLRTAIEETCPGVTTEWNGELYVNPLSKNVLRNAKASVDKVAVARAVARNWDDDGLQWPYDLEKNVRGCVNFIREANGMKPRNWSRSAGNS